jgi:START domain
MKSSIPFAMLAVTAVSVQGYAPSVPTTALPQVKKRIRQEPMITTESLGLELPDFDQLFNKIKDISPLARSVMSGQNPFNGELARGFAAITDDSSTSDLKWKRVESKKQNTVHQIDRIDNYNGLSVPLMRFRASLPGPCVGEYFGRFIMDLESRKKWDAQIEHVDELYPIEDLDGANIAMGFGRQYGDLARMGIGYAQTKAAVGITPREQMFSYGLQNFADGSCVIWGQEMDEKHNNLLPHGQRHTRSKSHIFSATLTPTSPESFDVEYLLQLDIGGKIPTWLTTPIMIDTVKNLFKVAKDEFSGMTGDLHAFLSEKANQCIVTDRHSLLMTPC